MDGHAGFTSIIPTIDTLPEEVRQEALGYLGQLCSPLLMEYQRQGEISNVPAEYLSKLTPTSAITAHGRAVAYKTLSKLQLLTISPLASALMAPWENLPDAEKFKQWLGLVILCCCSLHLKGDHASAIKAALAEIRLIATKDNHRQLLHLLPYPNDYHYLSELDQQLSMLKSEHTDLPSVHRAGLAHLAVVVGSVARNRKGIIRQRFNSKVSLPLNPHPEAQPYIVVEPVDSGVDGPEFRAEKLSPGRNGEHEDEPAELTRSATYRFNDSTLLRKELTLQALQSKRIAEQMQVRQLSLPCSFEQATDWDIQHLIAHALSALKKNDHVAGWLLLSLLSGRNLDTAQQVHLEVAKHTIPCLVLKHQVPASHQLQMIDGLLPNVLNTLYLPLPVQMVEWVRSSPQQQGSPQAQELRGWLTNINHSVDTRLTIGRVSRYLEHWMLNRGIDRAAIAVIRGESHKSRPSLSYTHQPRYEILTYYYEYVNAVFKLAMKKPELPPIQNKTGALGSRLYLPAKVLHNYFLLLANAYRVETNVLQFHNNYVAYVWALLSFVTGHRDVNAPMGLLSDLNDHQRTWWISDKERRHALAARTLIIPTTAIEQVELYKRHLANLAAFTRLTNKAVSQRSEQALQSNENLLFILDQQHDDTVPTELTPSGLEVILGGRLKWARNWGRHHLRSELSAHHLNPEVIDGWMGHEELGEEALGPYSLLGMSQLRQIADVIEDILLRHEIRALPGWQTL